MTSTAPEPKKPTLFGILPAYKGSIMSLIITTLIASGLGLFVPKIIAHAIDAYTAGTFNMQSTIISLTTIMVAIFIATYVQSALQVYTSENVAKDLRNTLTQKLATQNFDFIQTHESSKILSNMTTDIDAVKGFVAQVIASLASSIIVLIGAAILLIATNWKLGLMVVAIIPLLGGIFFAIFAKIKILFNESKEVNDGLNKIISETIAGAALLKILGATDTQGEKFTQKNTAAQHVGLAILSRFSLLIPMIGFISGLGTVVILAAGGHFVITDSMSLGEFSAFYSYLALLIFPIIVIGFTTSFMAQATSSFDRIVPLLLLREPENLGTNDTLPNKPLELSHINLTLNNKQILKDISFTINPDKKTAIIGPTAAGKTQLMYIASGLLQPTSGTITVEGVPFTEFSRVALEKSISCVFQDSILFNTTLKENIAFKDSITEQDLQLSIETASLTDVIEKLPNGLDTIISERGTNLSGGQKQRIMLARALAQQQSILFLDDFTAKVDVKTEQTIITNIQKNYPHLTLVSITQKINSIKDFDHIILLMEGELLAQGTHEELLASSLEYSQIYQSSTSTNAYEIHA